MAVTLSGFLSSSTRYSWCVDGSFISLPVMRRVLCWSDGQGDRKVRLFDREDNAKYGNELQVKTDMFTHSACFIDARQVYNYYSKPSNEKENRPRDISKSNVVHCLTFVLRSGDWAGCRWSEGTDDSQSIWTCLSSTWTLNCQERWALRQTCIIVGESELSLEDGRTDRRQSDLILFKLLKICF